MAKLQVQVKPNAKQQKIQQNDDGTWTVFLKSPPVEGKANQELVRLLSKKLGIPKSCIHIQSGEKSRHKRLEIEGIESLPELE
jgi:uncharacterized protein (TIGR00251 family)